jgi:hypothetical protein
MNKLIFEKKAFPQEWEMLNFIHIYLYSKFKTEFRIDLLKNLHLILV